MRIAIVRLTSLGDVVHTLPVAYALRRHDPSSYLVWIIEEREQNLLQNNPVVDEVVVGPTRRWRHELWAPAGPARVLGELRALGDQLRALRLEVAIDVQGLLKSSIFTVLSRAPIRIGFGWRDARDPFSCLFTTHQVTPPPKAVHIVEKNLSLLGPLGITAGDVAFPLPVVPEAEKRVGAFLQAHEVTSQDRLVVLLPGTRGRSKQWPPACYIGLASCLVKSGGIRIVLVGGPEEEALLKGIVRDLDGFPLLTFTSSIPDLVALLRRAHLIVGNDTGPLHIAAALGLPTIGLYGPTRSERNGPYGRRTRAIQSPTNRMEDIPVDTVFRAAMEWLT